MTTRISRSVPYLVGAGFIMPIIFVQNFIFPFIVPKIIFFRSLVLILLGIYLCLLSVDLERYRPRMTPITIGVLLFFASFAISTFSGVDWYRSFWDNHERMLGLFTIMHYVLLYLIASSVLTTSRDWNIVFRSALILGGWVMLIGIWQRWVNPELLMNRGSDRVFGTLGNPIYYSGYGLFLLFLGVIQWIRDQQIVWKYLSLAVAVMGFSAIFLGGTRGALLGLIVGAVVGGAFLLHRYRAHHVARYVVAGYVVLGVVLVSLFMFRETTVVQNIPAVGRLLNISIVETDTYAGTNTRVMAWRTAVESWQERPIFGWGPNNYYHAFNQYYNPRFLEHGYGETWFDNAHSVIFNTLTVQGIVGLLIYLGMFGAALYAIHRGIVKRDIHPLVGVLVIAFLIAHLVSNATVFENPTSYLYFFIILAFASSTLTRRTVVVESPAVVDNKKSKKTKKSSYPIIPARLQAIVGIFILIMLYTTNVLPARANRATVNTFKALYNLTVTENDLDQPFVYSSPHIDDIRNDLSRVIMEVLSKYQQNSELVNSLYTTARDELYKNQILHPLDVRVHYARSQVVYVGYQLSRDENLLRDAEADLRTALALSPRRQQVIYSLSDNLALQGRFDEAKELVRTSIEHNYRIGEGWYRLVTLMERNGEEREDIYVVLREAMERGAVFTESHANALRQVGFVTDEDVLRVR